MFAAWWRLALLLACCAGPAQAFDGIRVTLLGTHAVASATVSPERARWWKRVIRYCSSTAVRVLRNAWIKPACRPQTSTPFS